MAEKFQVNIQMDRFPAVNATDADLQIEVNRDNKLLQELRHGLGCGCGSCIGFAKQQRERLRGAELPTSEHGQIMDPFEKKGAK